MENELSAVLSAIAEHRIDATPEQAAFLRGALVSYRSQRDSPHKDPQREETAGHDVS